MELVIHYEVMTQSLTIGLREDNRTTEGSLTLVLFPGTVKRPPPDDLRDLIGIQPARKSEMYSTEEPNHLVLCRLLTAFGR